MDKKTCQGTGYLFFIVIGIQNKNKTKTTLSKMLAPYFDDVLLLIIEPGHEKMCLMPYANNKGADQPADPHILS